jgi:hypothetical protein
MTNFDPTSRGFPLQKDFDRTALEKLLETLNDFDEDLARQLREGLLGGGPPEISRANFEQLFKLSQTNGIYSAVADVARSIGELLFGRPLS